jgi:hypothetical protein
MQRSIRQSLLYGHQDVDPIAFVSAVSTDKLHDPLPVLGD